MAVNLSSVAQQLLTPDVIAQIASFVGIDRNTAQKVAIATIPTILAGLSDLVGTSAGANQLSKLLSEQQGTNPMDLLRTSGAQGLAQMGSSMLSGLLGGRTVDTMAQAIGKFAGTGEGGGKSLLAFIGPLVLGALGQQQRNAGLDATGLASLLRSQKDQIMAAIPSGLSDQLSASGLIDKAEAGARSGMSTAAAAGSRIAGVSERAGTGASQAAFAASRTQWPYILAAAVILGGITWYALQGPTEQRGAESAAVTRPSAGTVGVASPDFTVDGVNLASQVNSSLGTLKAALPTITDDASAQAALPKVNDAISQLDGITARAAKLSPDARSALAKQIIAATPAINQMCDKVLATPAGTIAKPAIDNLRAKLDELAKV
ncbi:hypothetical protein BRAS3843_770014 [Bradyrhizobium sp. STM 3843]|uniref:DUF937 domain-containing protein n=1 Tax=Bradyrhizobium sp. STM 3843 TaxID=551947 RepID=UPI0002404A19|nr:DUF937 domain-containing protein [Bradyrhizobium sp. STM 3843]CCE11716.1 hypothetical protein BRAS3843_770014 [Bradyrhizobium sp. STM 3843]